MGVENSSEITHAAGSDASETSYGQRVAEAICTAAIPQNSTEKSQAKQIWTRPRWGGLQKWLSDLIGTPLDSCAAVIVVAVLHGVSHMYSRWMAPVSGIGARCKRLDSHCLSLACSSSQRSSILNNRLPEIWRLRPLEENKTYRILYNALDPRPEV